MDILFYDQNSSANFLNVAKWDLTPPQPTFDTVTLTLIGPYYTLHRSNEWFCITIHGHLENICSLHFADFQMLTRFIMQITWRSPPISNGAVRIGRPHPWWWQMRCPGFCFPLEGSNVITGDTSSRMFSLMEDNFGFIFETVSTKYPLPDNHSLSRGLSSQNEIPWREQPVNFATETVAWALFLGVKHFPGVCSLSAGFCHTGYGKRHTQDWNFTQLTFSTAFFRTFSEVLFPVFVFAEDEQCWRLQSQFTQCLLHLDLCSPAAVRTAVFPLVLQMSTQWAKQINVFTVLRWKQIPPCRLLKKLSGAPMDSWIILSQLLPWSLGLQLSCFQFLYVVESPWLLDFSHHDSYEGSNRHVHP